MTKLKEFKEKMRTVPDHGMPSHELKIVNELLLNPPDEFDTILEWIFAEHKGYVEPRAQAGLKFMERNPTQGWLTLERLLASSDPDDRDTAITVLGGIGDTRKYHLVLPLLKDSYPYLQFEAVELLAKDYPEAVKTVLRELVDYKTQAWVSDQAKKLLHEMGEDVVFPK